MRRWLFRRRCARNGHRGIVYARDRRWTCPCGECERQEPPTLAWMSKPGYTHPDHPFRVRTVGELEALRLRGWIVVGDGMTDAEVSGR